MVKEVVFVYFVQILQPLLYLCLYNLHSLSILANNPCIISLTFTLTTTTTCNYKSCITCSNLAVLD